MSQIPEGLWLLALEDQKVIVCFLIIKQPSMLCNCIPIVYTILQVQFTIRGEITCFNNKFNNLGRQVSFSPSSLIMSLES